MNAYATQGRILIGLLKRRAYTYLEMLMLGVSTCPWKRIREQLSGDEQLIKQKDAKGRTTWRVTKAVQA